MLYKTDQIQTEIPVQCDDCHSSGIRRKSLHRSRPGHTHPGNFQMPGNRTDALGTSAQAFRTDSRGRKEYPLRHVRLPVRGNTCRAARQCLANIRQVLQGLQRSAAQSIYRCAASRRGLHAPELHVPSYPASGPACQLPPCQRRRLLQQWRLSHLSRYLQAHALLPQSLWLHR